MRSILVVSSDAERAERVKAALGAEGVWIAEVADREHALRVAADQAPDLVVVDSEVDGADDLLRSFGSAQGGPGTLLLQRSGERPPAGVAADSVVDDPVDGDRLAEEVRRLLAAPRGPAPAAHQEGDQILTAEEIFGDILREVESTDTGEWPAMMLDPEPAPSTRAEPPVAAVVPTPSAEEEAAVPDEAARPEEEAARLEEAPPVSEAEAETSTAPPIAPPPAVGGPSAEPSDERPHRFGHYELGQRIAVGGMAEIWEARMTGVEGFEKRVAIKKILPHLSDGGDFERMFVEEAKVAAGLNHENIIHIYDLGKINDHYFIAMEYVEGHDLGAILHAARRRGERIPAGLTVLIGARLASALDYAHRRPDAGGEADAVVHRDVSPRNILVGLDGRVKLCDFGVAKVASSMAPTQFGAIKGKIPYMSPEQAHGRAVDGRSDLFSLGAVLYEMATGKRLFAADSEISLLEAVRECSVRDPRELEPELPDAFASVILKALRRDPEERFAGASEMQRELEEILYSLRPTPGAEDLARYLETVFTEPEADASSFVPPDPPAPPPSSIEPLVPPAPAEVEEIGAALAADEAPEEATGSARWSRRRLALLAAVLAAAILVALVALWLDRSSPPPPVPAQVATPEVPAAVPAEEAPPEAAAAQATEEPATQPPPEDEVPLEELINRQLAEREAELRRIFQEDEERLRRELEELRATAPPEQPPPGDDSGGSGRPPG